MLLFFYYLKQISFRDMQQKEIQWFESKEVWITFISGVITVLMSIQKYSHKETTDNDIYVIHSILKGLLGSLQLQ